MQEDNQNQEEQDQEQQPEQQEQKPDPTILVIETCVNCDSHTWNTRHLESRYNKYYSSMVSALQGSTENLEVLQNTIPRDWCSFEPFQGRTDVLSNDRLMLYPHIGAFEIYHRGVLLYSKLDCRLWPNCKLVAKKIASYFEDAKNNGDLSKYAIKYKYPGKSIVKPNSGKTQRSDDKEDEPEDEKANKGRKDKNKGKENETEDFNQPQKIDEDNTDNPKEKRGGKRGEFHEALVDDLDDEMNADKEEDKKEDEPAADAEPAKPENEEEKVPTNDPEKPSAEETQPVAEKQANADPGDLDDNKEGKGEEEGEEDANIHGFAEGVADNYVNDSVHSDDKKEG